MLKKIILHNFMSHAHTELELGEGLAVIIGRNNLGKSAVVEALRVLAYNATGDYMVRHGADECYVTVQTDSGEVITWRRRKDVVSYEVNGSSIHRVGRDVPDEVQSILRLPMVRGENEDEFDVHFAAQKAPVFLLNDPGSKAATFFSASSDARLLVAMQQNFAAMVRTKKQERQSLEGKIESLTIECQTLAPVAGLQQEAQALEEESGQIAQCEVDIQARQGLIDLLTKELADVTYGHLLATALKELREPPQLTDVRPIEHLTTGMETEFRILRDTRAALAVMNVLQPIPQLAETEHLSRLTQSIVEETQQAGISVALAEHLENLAAPPELPDVAPLDECIIALHGATISVTAAKRQTQSLAGLLELPALIDTSELGAACSEWAVLSKEIAAGKRQIDSIEKEHNQLREEFEEFSKTNPRCPICGNTLSADAVLGEEMHSHA